MKIVAFRCFSGRALRGRHGMMAGPDTGISGKPRRRSAVKTASRQTAAKVKATIHLSVEADQRLSVHAAMLRMDRSEVMEALIQQHLKRFVVSDRSGQESGNAGKAESLNSGTEKELDS